MRSIRSGDLVVDWDFDKRVHTLQTAVDRLTAFMEKVLRTQKKRSDPN